MDTNILGSFSPQRTSAVEDTVSHLFDWRTTHLNLKGEDTLSQLRMKIVSLLCVLSLGKPLSHFVFLLLIYLHTWLTQARIGI